MESWLIKAYSSQEDRWLRGELVELLGVALTNDEAKLPIACRSSSRLLSRR